MTPNRNMAVCILGVACAGKTTLMNVASDYDGEEDERSQHVRPDTFGQIRVGEELRRRYSSEYFRGKGAPDHTQKEAMAIFVDGLSRTQLFPITLIDGQPRRVDQVDLVFDHALEQGRWCYVIVLHAPEEELIRRATVRSGNDPEALKLALARIEHDAYCLYSVLHYIHQHTTVPVRYVNSQDRSTFRNLLHSFINLCEGTISL